jgi:hypothetical protein
LRLAHERSSGGKSEGYQKHRTSFCIHMCFSSKFGQSMGQRHAPRNSRRSRTHVHPWALGCR